MPATEHPTIMRPAYQKWKLLYFKGVNGTPQSIYRLLGGVTFFNITPSFATWGYISEVKGPYSEFINKTSHILQ